MVSESARAASAAEARFRIQAPNSRPRATAVIALDAASEAMLQRLAGEPWNRATFLTDLVADPDTSQPEDGSVSDLSGRRRRVREEVDRSDQVIMLAAAAGGAEGAAVIGRACSRRRVTTTALIVGADRVPDRELSKTLAQLRPWSLMVVIAGNDDYIADIMTALRV